MRWLAAPEATRSLRPTRRSAGCVASLRTPRLRARIGLLAAVAAVAVLGCDTAVDDDGRGEQVGYRTGTSDDGWTNNGERGNINITEVLWSGSVRVDADGNRVHHPGDVFIELRNKHPRPMNLTGWLLTIDQSPYADGRWWGQTSGVRTRQEFVIPPRINRQPVEPNEYVTIAALEGGAFGEIPCEDAPDTAKRTDDDRCYLADYYIPGLILPNGPFDITIRDLDERLIDGAGDERKLPFAGGWDLVTSRSMERIQLIFNNRGNRDAAWHSYSLNDFDEGSRAEFHELLRSNVHPDFRAHTYATPGMPNSPDYSGFVSSGDFQ